MGRFTFYIVLIQLVQLQLTIVFGQNKCAQGVNCQLPDCFCGTFKHHFPVKDIPQIVYFALDDEIDIETGEHYERLFHPSRKNPNDCPITMTMFATNTSTNYTIMDKLFLAGMEVGFHHNVHLTNEKIISDETSRFKKYVEQNSNIPAESIIGYRSPYLATMGDNQVNILHRNGFKYDISYTYTRRSETGSNVWPLTLDFGWPYPCNINPCPKKSHHGFWEVPINSMWDYTKSDICAYADSCTYEAPSANEMYKYLWDNFYNSYSQNKAPFGLHLHGRWLNEGLRLWAVDKFIRKLLTLPDVYIVSINRMLEWLENPVIISELQNYAPWKCKHTNLPLPPIQSLPQRCEQEINCKLPNCFCDHLRHPLPKADIPQLVYFAFDGPIDGTVNRYFEILFHHSRKNPNGCPVRFNIFLSHSGTDYNYVQGLYDRGAEIGTNGLGDQYLATKQTVLDEASKMRENIVTKTTIPSSEIKGFRSPHLSPAGDEMIEALMETGYSYDISYTFTRKPHNALDAWPITLDYGWPYTCNTGPCPEKSHKGFWEVPVNSLYDRLGSDFCTFADDCRTQPTSEDETFQYLMNNFQNYYEGNRAPFGIHLHPKWFHMHRYLRGVNRFIEEILTKRGVYIVSVSDVIAWMKSPVKISQIKQLKNWKCPKIVDKMSPPMLPPPSTECENGYNCHLPNCFCPSLDHPLPKADIPQMVYFAFDDNVNLKYSGYYFNLFSPNRTNPNNCPMTFTLFTINKDTDYSFVEYFYQLGNEIASHGANNIPTNSKAVILKEAGSQKQNIIDHTNVTASKIIGFRSPQLSTAGDDQTDVLQKLGYIYDASYTYTRRPESGKNAWPFTGDYGWPYSCNIPPCPFHSHNGFWYIPVNSMWDYQKENICTFTDECKNQPRNADEVFDYLWGNFMNSYNGNRAPFGIHMQPLWLNDIQHLIGVRRFLDKLAGINDTYVLSISKVIEWMKNPTTLKNIRRFRPWMCYDSDGDLSPNIVQTTEQTQTPQTQFNEQSETVKHASLFRANTEIVSSGMGVPIFMSFSENEMPNTGLAKTISIKDIPKLSKTKVNFRSNDMQASINEGKEKTVSNILLNTDPRSNLNAGECFQGRTCLLPFCYCESKTIPLNLPKLATPQMVFLAFDGTLNHADHGPYLELLGNKKNPNNCSITATFFVNQVGSNITAIKDMYDRGYEIAMRGYNVLRPSNESMLESEIIKQLSELNRHGITDISGWKTVGYTSVTDEFKKLLYKYNFRYDSTNYYDNNNNIWPFTLDYGPTNHSLVWEIPNLALTDYLNIYQCQYADGCFNSPNSVNSTFTFLWNNFKKHYINGNKAPFGISLRKTWLSHEIYNDNIEGLKLFLDVILNLRDVYVVSTRQIMEWMENPIPLADIPRSQLWTCT